MKDKEVREEWNEGQGNEGGNEGQGSEGGLE